MRCLNKVVFINSANVPYAEVRLDGNVHFIGTQGVGKSTLLRAILFFYNGDKLKLGIPKEKKGFDDFYLPHSNSYIVYEVTHERSDFCVLVFRNQGRACFRFIDGGWDPGLLIDNDGKVTSEYTVIRQRLNGRNMSRIVDKYEEYRNIIYGNHRATEKGFYNYALMETPAYENVPRSLQNVFLNSRVDAEFIKDIILRSMNDEIPSVDLGYYRRQIAEFETEYNNISEWFRKDSKGEVPVRVQARKVIELYRQLIFLRKNIEQLYAELLYSDRTAREMLPAKEEAEQKHLLEIQRIERLISEQKLKLEKEKEEINKEIGEVESRLKDLKKKKEEYDKMEIGEIVTRVENEANVKLEQESLIKQKNILTHEFETLNTKYEILQSQINAEFQEFEANCNTRISELSEQCVKIKETIASSRQKRMDEIRQDYDAGIASIDERAVIFAEKDKELNSEIVKLQYFSPLGDEIKAASISLDELTHSEAVLRERVKSYDLQIGQLTQEYELQCSRLQSEYDRNCIDLEREIEKHKAEIGELEKLLSSVSGSLYEWLDGNLKGWENNVGKVIDKQKVLYSKGLKPRLTDGSSFFGVELDLDELPTSLLTPAQLRAEKEMHENAVEDIRAVMAEKMAEFEREKVKLSAAMSPKVKELREKRNAEDMNLQALPGQIKALKVKIDGLTDKQEEMRREKKAAIEERRHQLAAEKRQIENERKALKDKLSKSEKDADKHFSTKIKEAETDKDHKQDEIRAKIEFRRSEKEANIAELKMKRDAELHGAGVDLIALKKLETAIQKVENELRFIETNREICIQYRHDKKELFDKEDEFRTRKRLLESRKQQLTEKYSIHLDQLRERQDKQSKCLENVRTSINEAKKGFEDFDSFCHSETFPSYLNNVCERASLTPASKLVSDIKSGIFERVQTHDQFKKAVTLFKGHFGPGNIFKFKLNLVTDDDFMNFASDLEEFIEQNKIEDYRGRTSDRYLEILQRVSREIGDLSVYGSQVEKIIREINYDFKEKNFVGAIRSIEIRSTQSGDKMVQLLLKVKEFVDDNTFEMGQMNLFSEEAKRDDINRKAVRYLEDFMGMLNDFQTRRSLFLSDTFQLQFRVVENDNDTGWVEKIANVGSDGTDILVKAMVNIMLINVFKEKVSRKFGDFRIHCMMDEIGKLHPSNIKGILDFANSRNILLINSSPTTYNVYDYKHTYLLSKDNSSKTIVQALITRREAELGS